MAKMIQVRNVPDRLHRAVTKRARAAGQSLTDYIQSLLEREMSKPEASEVFARVAGRPKVNLGVAAAELLREERLKRSGEDSRR